MSKVRTAVVGLNMGYKHAKAYALAENADLRWVVDLDEEKARKTAEEFGCQYTTDWTSILDDVDAVSLCTPHHLHAPQALLAMEAGKHVLVEKPLANSEEECLQLIKKSEEKGVTLMLAYLLRFFPAIQRMKQAVDTEEFGKAFNISCWVEAFMPPAPGSWFSKKSTLGGGVLFSHGCHYVDVMQWIMGDPVTSAEVGTQSGTEWMEGEGSSHSIYKYPNGAIGSLFVSWGTKYKDSSARYHIHTPEAVLILNNPMTKLEAVTANGRITLYEPPQGETPFLAYGQVEHFLQCIQSGTKPQVDGEEALKSLRTIWQLDADKEVQPVS